MAELGSGDIIKDLPSEVGATVPRYRRATMPQCHGVTVLQCHGAAGPVAA